MSQLFQLKIQLKNVKPAVYRVVLLPESASFFQLHKAIQEAMGWEDYHLFQFFKQRDVSISIPNKEYDWNEVLDAQKIKLNEWLNKVKDTITYEYDFGDGWEHAITLEKITENERKVTYPECIRGKRSCPPEDCGGPWGYENLLAVLADKKHPEHEGMQEWIGEGFDPEYFDIEVVNKLLKKIKIKI